MSTSCSILSCCLRAHAEIHMFSSALIAKTLPLRTYLSLMLDSRVCLSCWMKSL